MATNTIADIVLANSGGQGLEAFDVLLAALQAADPEATGLLGAALDPAQDLTVFAPTDDAFLGLAQVIDPSATTEGEALAVIAAASAALSPVYDPTAFLKTVLSYHISAGAQSKAEVQASGSIATLAGLDLAPSGEMLGDEEPDLDDAQFAPGLSDLAADNGVVHVIDKVLLPYDITFAEGGMLKTKGGPDAVIGSDGKDKIFLGSGNDAANGGAGNDLLRGANGDDVLNGGDGNDDLSGGRGNDALAGGAGRDVLLGRHDDDHLSGGDGGDKLKGDVGKDVVLGNEGNDVLMGGRNDDIIAGGSGDDILRGGNGADQFVFNPGNAGPGGEPLEGRDVVRDFNIGQGDTLVLDMSGFDQGTLDTLAAADGNTSELELIDLLTAGVVELGASKDGDLLIKHPTGRIELDGISAKVAAADLIPAVKFNFDPDFVA
jgi:Ca2+-binding RTX toxin-like protein